MPVVSGLLDNGHAIVRVEAGVSGPRSRSLVRQGKTVAVPQAGFAIIDTGADLTCIDHSVRVALNLTPFNRTPILTPSSGAAPGSCYLYKMRLSILHASGNPLDFLTFDSLSVLETSLAHLGSDLLIGCDVLAQCLFQYDGRVGSFSLTF